MINYKTIFTVFIVLAMLYFMKVPGVVSFIDGALAPVITFTNYVIDVGTHVRERHPFIYMSLFFVLLYLMRPEYNSHSFRKQ